MIQVLVVGGVQVYEYNVIHNMQYMKDIKIFTLSSGIAYNGEKKCFVQKLKSDGIIERYQIVNSPMIAPSKASFYDQEIYLTDDSIKEVFRNFLNQIGGVDIIHFQSLEGFTLKVLELKDEFPKTKFIVSLHNYHCFCPQVNLWKNDSECCDNFHNGNDCLNCLGMYPNSSSFKKYYLLDYYLRKAGLESYSTVMLRKIKQIYEKVKAQNPYPGSNVRNDTSRDIEIQMFLDFRKMNVSYINHYVDTVLCVSKRVQQIAIKMGIVESKTLVRYIGSAFADFQKVESKYPYKGGVLKIAYMGYMRKDKGFYFLLNTFERMSPELAHKISLVIAARFDDMVAVERLKSLSTKFAAIKLYNGYTHDQIHEIVSGVHLGIVPVLWEDNLPQVAIEFKALGIPVLASNRGGPSELSDSPYFVFKSGDRHDFEKKLEKYITNPEIMHDYWDKQHHLVNMREHCNQLMKLYSANL